ncbi:uncharacterized protein LOC143245520 [Tachypleus tridentatus]|uniref:uncharacterized protein LOC143245520 n=1 Tax=Tachypleus tridentatus TaxID=6853 RepID=UPI003FCF311A
MLFRILALVSSFTGYLQQTSRPNFDAVSGFGDPRIFNLVVCDSSLTDEVRVSRNQCFQNTKPEVVRKAELVCREMTYPNATDIEFLESICSDNGTLTKMMWRCIYDEMVQDYPGIKSYSKNPTKQSLTPSEVDMLHLLRTYLGYGSFFQGFQPNRLRLRLARLLSGKGNPELRDQYQMSYYQFATDSTFISNRPSNIQIRQLSFDDNFIPFHKSENTTHSPKLKSYDVTPDSGYGYTTRVSITFGNDYHPYGSESSNYGGQGPGNNNNRPYGSGSSSYGWQQSSDSNRPYGSGNSSYGGPQPNNKYYPYGPGGSSYGGPQPNNKYYPYRPGGSSYGGQQSGNSNRPYGSGGSSYGGQSSNNHRPYGSGDSSFGGQHTSDTTHPFGEGNSNYGSQSSNINYPYGSWSSLYADQHMNDNNRPYGSGGSSYGGQQSGNSNHPYELGSSGYGYQHASDSYLPYGSGSSSYGGQQSNDNHGSVSTNHHTSYGPENFSYGNQHSSGNYQSNRPGGSSFGTQGSFGVSGSGTFHQDTDRPFGSSGGSPNNYYGGGIYPASGSISGSHLAMGGQQYESGEPSLTGGGYTKPWSTNYWNKPEYNGNSRPHTFDGYGGGNRPELFPDLQLNKFNLPESLYVSVV